VQAIESVNADLIRRTAREAAAGAAIVAWSETAARILATQEKDFVRALSELAATAKIHLFAGYGTYTHGATKPLGNRFVAISPDGEVSWTFDKAHPIVGGESLMLAPGDGALRIAQTPTASVTAAICHDFDFPPLIRQASKQGATLLLAPSADWPEITAMHANMALLRAVENGIPLVRPTSGGRTLISDGAGVVISQQDAPRDAVVATVTPGRMTTAYGLFGDWFAYGCIAGFVVLIARASGPRTSGNPGGALLATRMAAARAAILVVGCCLVAVTSGAQEKSPLASANGALEACIASAKSNDEAATTAAADQADRLYAEAERSGAPKAHVLTGRARVLSQCRTRHAGFLQQPGHREALDRATPASHRRRSESHARALHAGAELLQRAEDVWADR
jgi:predicted amidohydrolase